MQSNLSIPDVISHRVAAAAAAAAAVDDASEAMRKMIVPATYRTGCLFANVVQRTRTFVHQ